MACEKALEVMASIPLSAFENIPKTDETKSNLKTEGFKPYNIFLRPL